MVGLVVVAHSRALAHAAVRMVAELLPGPGPRIEVAAGLDEDVLGTDATAVAAAIERADDGDGVVVLLDLGSAVLSAELALELLDDGLRSRVRLSPAPLVEGLLAAAATAVGGGSLDEVAAEAAAGLQAKQAQLEPVAPSPTSLSADPVAPEAAAEAAAQAELEPASEAATTTEAAAGAEERLELVVTDPHGLHARPAARLVAVVRAQPVEVWLTDLASGAGPVPARSLSAVTTLGVTAGHRVALTARGPGAPAAVAAGRAALAGAAEVAGPAEVAGTAAVAEPAWMEPIGAGPVVGAPGLAIGPACRLAGAGSVEDEAAVTPSRLADAVTAARREIAATRDEARRQAGPASAEIFEAHLLLLDDLEAAAREQVAAAPVQAWRAACRELAGRFSRLADPYLRSRAADVAAVGDQVLALLQPERRPTHDVRGIVLAEDLTPAQVVQLDPGVIGVVLAAGGPTAHAALLARARGLPMLVAAGPAALAIPDGTQLVLDAERGELLVDPPAETLAGYRDRVAGRAEAARVAAASAHQPARTRAGRLVPVLANVGSPADAEQAAAAGADGIGLVRTEFCFAGRDTPPGVAEQVETYRAIASAITGRLVVRTLDAGADKPLPFLPSAPEPNPYLGVRGLRLSLRRPDLLRDQLRALATVAAERPLDVMFPMVTRPAELSAALGLLDEACDGRRPEGLRVGIMVEVPAVALRAAEFLPAVDFFSVGSNDLTQYALAADRGNPGVAGLVDPLDAGVLRLVAELCVQAGDRPVSVCGELAADPAATGPLLAAGVTALSVVPSAVAAVKQAVRAC